MALKPHSRSVLVMAPYLSPRTRELLAAARACYADATGNLRLVLDRPAIFVEHAGAQRDPQRKRRHLQSLKGPAAARVMQALLTLPLPCTVREFARAAQIPASSVSRVVSVLTREAVVARGSRGEIQRADRSALLRFAAEQRHAEPASVEPYARHSSNEL